MVRRAAWWPYALTAVSMATLVGATACREIEGTRVADLSFAGNEAFSDAELTEVLATRETGPLPWSRPEIFSRALFEADLARLVAFYDDRGYPDARVTAVDVDLNDRGDEVRLRIHVNEGAPIRVERIVVDGLAGLPRELVHESSELPLEPGKPLDRRLVAACRDHVAFALRDHGYPDARVSSRTGPGSADRLVVLTIEAERGQEATFGEVSIVGLESVEPSVVLRTLAFEPGQTYRESRVLESQRRLFGLGIFDFAHVAGKEDAGPDSPGQPMVVTVKEGSPTRVQVGIGYGTEDGPRGSLRWTHLNLLGGAQQLNTDAQYSARLQGVGGEFVQPYAGARSMSLVTRGGAWWRDEPTYTSRSLGFGGGLTFHTQVGRGLDKSPIDRIARVTYDNESLRYTIDPESLGDPSNAEELIAVGIDPATGSGSGRAASLSLEFEQTSVDQPLDPRRGYSVFAHIGHAAPWLGGTFDYDELRVDGRVYVPIGPSLVWAGRARAGALFAASSDAVPFSARYFQGGSTSLRGWGRFEIAPQTTDGIPIGGEAVVELSSELRAALPGAFSLVFFVDAGNVWLEPSDIRLDELHVDVGPGVRWITAFGVIRADVGVQVNPIDNLLIDGAPQTRRWRIHLSFGHAF